MVSQTTSSATWLRHSSDPQRSKNPFTISTFSRDIAHAVSRGTGGKVALTVPGISATAEWLRVEKTDPPEETAVKTDEMTSILEAIIRDEATNPTARRTAIRTLRQIEADDREPADELQDELERILARDN